MEKLHIKSTSHTPEIILSPADYTYSICGMSSPEDVRAIYYPVIDWFKRFSDEIRKGTIVFTLTNPLKLKVNLEYFNSSSAKFLFDIFYEMKKMRTSGIPVIVEWHYQEGDLEMMEAGKDMSSYAEIDFTYIEDKG
ncbi:MAG TPA: DUF1987 domain-containing protein [Bacteroidales bacterium]|nr:DUF1987 domain-containing protein [Bacteroidales bacterium]